MLAAPLAHGQTPDAVKDHSFNTLAKPPDAGDGKWGWNLALGATINRGDQHATRSNFSLDGERAMRDSRLMTHALSIREQSRHEDRKEIASLGFRAERNINEGFFGFGDATLDRDSDADIKRRVAMSLGVGYRLFDNQTARFNVYAGLSGVDATYAEAEDARGGEALFGQELSWEFSEKSRLRERLVYYPYTVGAGGPRTALQITLNTHIASVFSLQLGLLHKYQAHVPADSHRHNMTVYLGLGVSF